MTISGRLYLNAQLRQIKSLDWILKKLMNRTSKLFLALFVVGLIGILGACQPKIKVIPAPTLTATEVGAVTETPVPTPTFTATATPTETLTSTPTPTPTVTATFDFLADYPPEGYGPVNFPANVNPLTGLQILTTNNLNRRPISVKVAHYPRSSRPTWGLSQADHVFEYYHEAGLTRFHAIFYSQDVHQIGPIRSARFTDKDLVEMYKSFLAYGSADWRIRERFAYSDFTDRLATITDMPCPPSVTFPLCRLNEIPWNNLVTDTTYLHQHFDDKGVANHRQNLDGLAFNPTLPPNGHSADSVLIRYSFGSQHYWEYDPSLEKYIRHQDVVDADAGQEVFEPTLDRLSGEVVTADNVVILLAKYQYYSVRPEILEIPFEGYGKAYVFRNGYAYPVNWGRLNDAEIIFLSNQDSSRFQLKPGNTWFVVIGATSFLNSSSPDWNFQFFIP
jgi:hypothetical protein